MGEAMNASDLLISATFSNLIALFGTLSLIVGGAALIAASIPMRAELLERRVNLALPRTAIVGARAGKANPSVMEQLPSLAAGLSEAEQRQLIAQLKRLYLTIEQAPHHDAPHHDAPHHEAPKPDAPERGE